MRINDKIVWECLKGDNIINIAKAFGCDLKMDYIEYDKICKEKHTILEKYGLDSMGCSFNEEILGEDDYREYQILQRQAKIILRQEKEKYIDRCIDWLMENGYWVKVVKDE